MIVENVDVARRWPLLVLFSGAVLLAAFGPVTWSILTTRAPPEKKGVAPPDHVRLARILTSLKGAWSPSARQHILDDARGQLSVIEPAMRRVLEQASPADFIPVCNLAVAMNLKSVRPILAAHASDRQSVVGTQALRAAHALEPYTWDQLASFLDGPPSLVVAALECAKAVDGRDNVRIARLLASADHSIREAASAALHPSPGSEAMNVILGLVESARPGVASSAQRAFLRLDWDAVTAGWVGNLFARADADIRCLVLERILREGQPWLPTHDLWRVAREDGPMTLRTLAFQCLELIGGVDSNELLGVQRHLPPMLRYHAARCAIGDKKQEAAAILLDLVESGDTAEPTAKEASVQARILLANLSGTPMHEEPSAWRDWLRRNPDFDASAVRAGSPPR